MNIIIRPKNYKVIKIRQKKTVEKESFVSETIRETTYHVIKDMAIYIIVAVILAVMAVVGLLTGMITFEDIIKQINTPPSDRTLAIKHWTNYLIIFMIFAGSIFGRMRKKEEETDED